MPAPAGVPSGLGASGEILARVVSRSWSPPVLTRARPSRAWPRTKGDVHAEADRRARADVVELRKNRGAPEGVGEGDVERSERGPPGAGDVQLGKRRLPLFIEGSEG